jgi:hypothetical protein
MSRFFIIALAIGRRLRSRRCNQVNAVGDNDPAIPNGCAEVAISGRQLATYARDRVQQVELGINPVLCIVDAGRDHAQKFRFGGIDDDHFRQRRYPCVVSVAHFDLFLLTVVNRRLYKWDRSTYLDFIHPRPV